MSEQTGHCLCGGVQFQISGALAAIQVCHCESCRRAQGGPLATSLPVERAALRFTAGQDLLTRFQSSAGKHRVFCRVCGSPVYSERDSLPGVVRVRAGLLDEPVTTRPATHAHLDSASSWWPQLLDVSALAAAIEQFAMARDWTQFHSPKNLVMALTGEAGELTEIFQWMTEEASRHAGSDPDSAQHVREELADVMIYLVRLAAVLGVDFDQAVRSKLALNARKYPVDTARGNNRKYKQP